MRKGQSSANGAGKMDNNMQIKKEKLDPCLNTLHKNQITVDLRFKIYFTCFNAILPNLPTFSLSHRVHKTVLYISYVKFKNKIKLKKKNK